MQKLLKQKPAPLTSAANLDYITAGNLEDDAAQLKDADWIIEVVVENLDVKKQIFSLVDEYRNREASCRAIRPVSPSQKWRKADLPILKLIS